VLGRIYTGQWEELASYGYVVVAITHTYDAALTIFPDGRRIRYKEAPFHAVGSAEDQSIAYANARVEWAVADMRFALDELQRENRMAQSSSRPFAGHLDFRRVGAFGHSAGGRAAARVCQLDLRFRACLNQDGVAYFQPFYLSNLGWGMDQAFLLMERAPRPDPPTDQELAEMKMTRAEAEALVAALKSRKDSVLGQTGKGSYWVQLNPNATTHMSFSDLPVLAARNAEADQPARVLQTVRDYTRAFFDTVLRGQNGGLLESRDRGEFLTEIQKFPAARRPRGNATDWPPYPPSVPQIKP
jgi:hypothetical protein